MTEVKTTPPVFVPVEAKWAGVIGCDRPTRGEWDVLNMLVNGMDSEQIAGKLDIKPTSVKQTISRIREKLCGIEGIGDRLNGYAKRGEIIRLLIDQGFFAPQPPE